MYVHVPMNQWIGCASSLEEGAECSADGACYQIHICSWRAERNTDDDREQELQLLGSEDLAGEVLAKLTNVSRLVS
jgi:hypothetical protein